MILFKVSFKVFTTGLFLLLFLPVFVSGCNSIVKVKQRSLEKIRFSEQIQYDPTHYPVIIDNLNSKGEAERQTYVAPPRRIVSVWQNSIETPLALGVGDRIIAGMGIPDKKYLRLEYQEAYEKIPFTSLENLDLETILMMEPELIIGWASTFSAKVLRSTAFWQGRGIHTYIAPSSSSGRKTKVLEDEFQDIKNLGEIFDRGQDAEKIIGNMQREIAFVVEKSANIKHKPRGLVIELMGKTVRSYGKNTLAGDIFRKLQAEHLGKDEIDLSFEQLIEMDPDVIFLVTTESDYGNENVILNRLYGNKALRELKCVKEKRIYTVPLYAIYSPGIRSQDGIQIIARGLYPDLYKER